MLVGYSGFAFTVIGVILSDKSNGLPLLPLIGVPVFAICILLVTQTLRCPSCSGNLGRATMAYGSPFSISKSIRYCPFCNADLDKENTSSSIAHHERADKRHGDDNHTATIKIKLFKRLFILELVLLALMFGSFTVVFFQNPKERYDMFIFSTLFITFLFCQFYMAYYLGIEGLIEYDTEIYTPSFNIARIYWKTTNKTPKKFVFIVYVATFLSLVLCGITLYLTSSHH